MPQALALEGDDETATSPEPLLQQSAQGKAAGGKPSAQAILREGGGEGMSQYLEEHPQSPTRIQAELRGMSLLGGADLCYEEVGGAGDTEGGGEAGSQQAGAPLAGGGKPPAGAVPVLPLSQLIPAGSDPPGGNSTAVAEVFDAALDEQDGAQEHSAPQLYGLWGTVDSATEATLRLSDASLEDSLPPPKPQPPKKKPAGTASNSTSYASSITGFNIRGKLFG